MKLAAVGACFACITHVISLLTDGANPFLVVIVHDVVIRVRISMSRWYRLDQFFWIMVLYLTPLMSFCHLHIKFWGDFEEPEGHAKDFVNMWGAVEYYFAEYPLETDPIQPFLSEDGSYGIEYTFAVPTNQSYQQLS